MYFICVLISISPYPKYFALGIMDEYLHVSVTYRYIHMLSLLLGGPTYILYQLHFVNIPTRSTFWDRYKSFMGYFRTNIPNEFFDLVSKNESSLILNFNPYQHTYIMAKTQNIII